MRSMKTLVMSIAFLSMLGTVQMTGCSHDDTTIVTISLNGDVGTRTSVNDSIFNKIFRFFVNDLLASAAPHSWVRDAITLTITGEDMTAIEVELPPSQFTYSIEVPAGDNRLFTVIASNSNIKTSGGSAVKSLTAGESVQVTINMKPIVQNFTATGGGSIISMSWQNILGVSGYKIYRSTSSDGTYILNQTITGDISSNASDSPSVGTYYYKIKVYYSDSEGEFCDYKVASTM